MTWEEEWDPVSFNQTSPEIRQKARSLIRFWPLIRERVFAIYLLCAIPPAAAAAGLDGPVKEF